MVPQLKDLMDLEYLLHLDDRALVSGDTDEADLILARDRDIFQQVRSDDDRTLILSWLDYRKLVHLDAQGGAGMDSLPGNLFFRRFRLFWYAIMALGGMGGLMAAFSFLSYHGSEPVNLNYFVFLFILIPFCACVGGGWVLIRAISKRPPSPLTRFFLHFFSRRFLADTSLSDFFDETGLRGWQRENGYAHLMAWPFLNLTFLLGMMVSLGIFLGTFFKIVISDLAFGWQSTLASSVARVHDIVSLASLPWSWLFPHLSPGMEQIEGSRMILKQGMDTMATADLISWWPFLCLCIFVYGVLPRFMLLCGGYWVEYRHRRDFIFCEPEHRRLLARMKSPGVTVDAPKKTEAVPSEILAMDAMPELDNLLMPDGEEPGDDALILVPHGVWDETDYPRLEATIEKQFLLSARVASVTLGQTPDVQLPENGPVIFLQEVWQPPIRGLLHDFVCLEQALNRPLWILLTQSPGEANLRVDPNDINARVWEAKVLALGRRNIRVVRMEEK